MRTKLLSGLIVLAALLQGCGAGAGFYLNAERAKDTRKILVMSVYGRKDMPTPAKVYEQQRAYDRLEASLVPALKAAQYQPIVVERGKDTLRREYGELYKQSMRQKADAMSSAQQELFLTRRAKRGEGILARWASSQNSFLLADVEETDDLFGIIGHFAPSYSETALKRMGEVAKQHGAQGFMLVKVEHHVQRPGTGVEKDVPSAGALDMVGLTGLLGKMGGGDKIVTKVNAMICNLKGEDVFDTEFSLDGEVPLVVGGGVTPGYKDEDVAKALEEGQLAAEKRLADYLAGREPEQK